MSVAERTDPFTGRAFKPLSKSYAKYKQAQGNSPVPNLELDGDMLDALDYRITPDGIELGVFGAQAGKADGHCDFSGDSNIPTRRFLPEDSLGRYQRDVDMIIQDALGDTVEIPEDRLERFSQFLDGAGMNKTQEREQLYAFLNAYFPNLTGRASIKTAVLRLPDLVEMLDGEDLLDLL